MSSPTTYPEINTLLDSLLSNVQSVLGDQFVGLYLYGSLASGDFEPESSDIDFLVVTRSELPDTLVNALGRLHGRLWNSGSHWAAKLEGSYLPLQWLARYDPAKPPIPHVNEGKFYMAGHGSDWVIQRHVIREHTVALAGPDVRPLIDPVGPDELKSAVTGVLREWWAPMLDDPSFLKRNDYQAFAVLTMCRALYAFEHGTIVSKPVAARWAQQMLGERRSTLIQRALAGQHGAPMNDIDEIQELIRYTLEQSQAFSVMRDP